MRASDLPVDRDLRDRVVLALMGSPDPRQVDGLGGAHALTSKFVSVGPTSRADAHVEYHVIQVGIDTASFDTRGNCGNLSAAVALFAVQEGWVQATSPSTNVRIFNLNTGKTLVAHVPATDDEEAVPEHGPADDALKPESGILLDYSNTVGTQTGNLFPTGRVVDELEIAGTGTIAVTLADLANPVVYVAADALGLSGIESPQDMVDNREVSALLERIRSHAAVAFGMATSLEAATVESPQFPFLSVVQCPREYTRIDTGEQIETGDIDIVVRMHALQEMHTAYAGTGAANLGVTALVPGTVVYGVLSEKAKATGVVRFGHPSGVGEVEAGVMRRDGEWIAKGAGYRLTARRIMDGQAYLPPLDHAVPI